MRTLQWLEQWVSVLERSAVVASFAGLMMLGLLQIILRNVFASGWFGADEVLRHLVLWIGFFGASLATREQSHLRIDIWSRVLPSRYQSRFDCVTNLLALVVCVMLARAAWTFVSEERVAEAVLTVGIAAWVAQIIMPLGFCLMACRFALHLVNAWIQATRKFT
jgi:TRAP-type C4-dicarboxylate transport system permease small subunit